jgi:hypothetical protein
MLVKAAGIDSSPQAFYLEGIGADNELLPVLFINSATICGLNGTS